MVSLRAKLELDESTWNRPDAWPSLLKCLNLFSNKQRAGFAFCLMQVICKQTLFRVFGVNQSGITRSGW